MNIKELPIEGALLINSTPHKDNRGRFSRIYCNDELTSFMGGKNIVQVNLSENFVKGSIRGMHYQKKPKQEIKFIKCLKGSVFDVMIDLRNDSVTFLQWFGVELNESDNNTLLVPEGCAHGFQVLEQNSNLLYFHSEFYDPSFENGILYNDPSIQVKWPLPISLISKKDLTYDSIGNNFQGA